LKLYHRVHRIPPMDPILRQLKPDQTQLCSVKLILILYTYLRRTPPSEALL